MSAPKRFNPFDVAARAKAAAARNQGLASMDVINKAVPGSVFSVDDAPEIIDFPTARAPNAGTPHREGTRRVIVVQNYGFVRARSPITVLVVPCSSSGEPTPADVVIPAGEAGSAVASVAYTSIVQAVLKKDLKVHLGDLSPDTFAKVRAKLGQLTDLDSSARFVLPGSNTAPEAAASEAGPVEIADK